MAKARSSAVPPDVADAATVKMSQREGEQLLKLLAMEPSRDWRQTAPLREVAKWVGLLNTAQTKNSAINQVLTRAPTRSDFEALLPVANHAADLLERLQRLGRYENQAFAERHAPTVLLSRTLGDFLRAAALIAGSVRRLASGRGRQPNLALQEAVRGLRALYRWYLHAPASQELTFVTAALNLRSSAWMKASHAKERRAELRRLFRDPRFEPAPERQDAIEVIAMTAAANRAREGAHTKPEAMKKQPHRRARAIVKRKARPRAK
jgi:hypothetical protein